MNNKSFELLNDRIDVIGYAETPFHMLGVIAYAIYLSDLQDEKVNCILLNGRHSTAGRILQNVMLNENKYINIEEIDFDMRQDRINILDRLDGYKRNNNTLYMVTPLAPWVKQAIILKNKGWKVQTVCIDDGIGSYLTPLEFNLTFFHIRKKFSILLMGIMKNEIKILLGRLCRIESSSFSIFNKKDFMNNRVINYYKTALEVVSDIKYNFEPKSIVYLSQPDYDEYKKEHNVYIEKMLRQYKEEGYTVYLKRHPRDIETYDSIKAFIIELPKEKSIEEILGGAKCKPELLIGHCSTGLITARLFWNIKTITLIDSRVDNYENNTFLKILKEKSSYIEVGVVDLNKIEDN